MQLPQRKVRGSSAPLRARGRGQETAVCRGSAVARALPSVLRPSPQSLRAHCRDLLLSGVGLGVLAGACAAAGWTPRSALPTSATLRRWQGERQLAMRLPRQTPCHDAILLPCRVLAPRSAHVCSLLTAPRRKTARGRHGRSDPIAVASTLARRLASPCVSGRGHSGTHTVRASIPAFGSAIIL